MSCTRSQEFLAKKKIEVEDVTDAKSKRYSRKEVLELARAAKKVVVAKGKKVVSFDMTKKPSDDEVLAAMLGPSGNLRAPTIKVKDTLVVGFNDEAYTDSCSDTPKRR